jgi:hypothetical protein
MVIAGSNDHVRILSTLSHELLKPSRSLFNMCGVLHVSLEMLHILSFAGSNYYVRILSTLNREPLPAASSTRHNWY